ncbi:hypothetical protein HYO05_21800 [Vibrio parahaemolyticus]|nr:hypothetical protein [Vibrio parahaemolyticus]MBM5050420.1 hypothetical protein [Vibrio parahaemolyticus]MBM5077866.1 hypothetical protein [Vibrio parahaemolyticus]
MQKDLETYRWFSNEFEAVLSGKKVVSDEQFDLIISGLVGVVEVAVLRRVVKNLGTLGS